MNASPSLPKLLFFLHRLPLAPALVALFALAASAAGLLAQDSLTLTNGDRREGKITGVSGGNVRIAIKAPAGTVETSVPLANVKSASMEAPSELSGAQADLVAGNAKAAAAKLAPVVGRFMGLPVTWMPRASTLLVDAHLESGDADAAEKALVAFNTSYPGASELTPLLQAKLAIARNNFVGAKPLLAPIVERGASTKLADAEQSALYGQAFYLMGLVNEQEGALDSALENYIRTTTLFFEDAATANKARERVEVLTKEKNVVVP